MTERFGQISGQGGAVNAPDDDGARHRAALTDVLRRLTAPVVPSPEGRRLDCGPGRAALFALLDEIDSTVMARSLRVSAADGAALILEVSNRRLLHVDEASDRGGPQAGLGALGFAGLDDLNRLLGLLEDLCAAGPPVIESLAPSGTVSVEQTGVSVATLREAIAATSEDAGAAPATDADGRASDDSMGAADMPAPDAPGAASQGGMHTGEVPGDDDVAASAEAAARAAAMAAETVSAAAEAAYADALGKGDVAVSDAAARLSAFACACAADALCWQTSDGASGGEPDLQEPLEEVWELWPEGLLARSDAPVLTILSPVEPAGAPLLLAQIGEDALAMLLAPTSEPRVTVAWLSFVSEREMP